MPVAEEDSEGRARVGGLVDGLREIGLIEGRNLKLEVRWGSSDVERLREYASELIGLAPEVLLAGSTPSLAALHRATANIPIVFVLVSDPVGQGYVQSLAHPGGNVTGFTSFEFSAIGKWLGLLKDVAPSTRRAAVIFNPDTAPYTQQYLQPFKDAAKTVAVEATTAPVRSDTDIERAIAALAGREGGIIIMSDPFTSVHRTAILSMAARHRVPAVYPYRFFAVDGGLLSYGTDTPDLFRRSASYVDRILNGAKPADLPVQQPTKFELVINLKTANALGLTVPATLLARADEVIE
jgi:putative ABC transport system substrate-binding protein